MKVGDTVVSVCGPTVCTLLERDGRMYTWFIVHAHPLDDFQRPGTVFTTEASAHDEIIEGWIWLKGPRHELV